MINKKHLIELIINSLQHDLAKATMAAKEAHAAATNDQSVAETQYDTLAIEAGYLAEGQSRRIIEIKSSIKIFKNMLTTLTLSESNSMVANIGCLIQLAGDEPLAHWFFLAPSAGGLRIPLEQQHITLITPQSPMGEALIGKEEGEDIDIGFSRKLAQDYIIHLY